MLLKIGLFTVNTNHVVYTERDIVAVPETITLHLVNGETLMLSDTDAVMLAGFFEDQAQIINI